jgi:RTX calcium-binding nonapeptide repeat (4 copies)
MSSSKTLVAIGGEAVADSFFEPVDDLQLLSFPQKSVGRSKNTLDPVQSIDLYDQDDQAALPKAASGQTDQSDQSEAEGALAATTASPFWSLLSQDMLQDYTWYGSWAPPDHSYTLPSRTLHSAGGKGVVSGTNASEAIYGLAGSELLMGEGGHDFIAAGDGDDGVLGGRGHDVLLGEGGDDALDGGSGNDWIGGGSGVDTLTGWTGKDVFAFILNPLSDLTANGEAADGEVAGGEAADVDGPDIVTDFTLGEDLILIGGLLESQPAAGADPLADYVELTQLKLGTLVSVNRTNAAGDLVSTQVALLSNIVATDLSASSFVLA